MYIWQFGIGTHVTYGRTWKEFEDLLVILEQVLHLSPKRHLIIYVHNLSFEFQFIRKRFKWEKVFLLDSRVPVYATMADNGITFKCSYKLSMKSLAKVGEDLINYPVQKLVGSLKYRKIRHSTTPLTDRELAYCLNDIAVLLSYIQEKIETDGDILHIPLTNTGYVRRYCRERCFADYKTYSKLMSRLTLEVDEYSSLKRAFQGGFTHANSNYVNQVHYNVTSLDFASSYPAVMVYKEFPMSKGTHLDTSTPEEILSLMDKYCVLFDIHFDFLVPLENFEHPLSLSKCTTYENETVDNGRIVTASNVTTTITGEDFLTLREFYSWVECTITNVWYYRKAHLPIPFILAILDLYKNKTRLKGVPEEYVNYMISKGMLNSAYGMAVTNIIRDVLDYDDDYLPAQTPDTASEIDAYNRKKNRFLFYPWGVWVTAYARRNLFEAIYAMKGDYIYSDTDSVKIYNYESHKEWFDAYNEHVKEEVRKTCWLLKIDIESCAPKTVKGVTKFIGVWEKEGTYTRFKALNAKRYMVEHDGKIETTVAGASKFKLARYLRIMARVEHCDPFDLFKDGLTVRPRWSGRLHHIGVDEERSGTIVDYNGVEGEYHELSCEFFEEVTYSISMTKDFITYLQQWTEVYTVE